MLRNLSLVMDFWELFSLISFLKNFSRMKRCWREELQLPVTIKRSFLSSYKWNKLFERCRQLRLLPKQILFLTYFMFWIIFTKWIWFVNSFKCVSDRNVYLRAKSWNKRKNCFWTMTEKPYKIVWGCRTCG